MTAMDIRNRDDIRVLMQKAIKDGDTEGFYQALDQMLTAIQTDLQQSYEDQLTVCARTWTAASSPPGASASSPPKRRTTTRRSSLP